MIMWIIILIMDIKYYFLIWIKIIKSMMTKVPIFKLSIIAKIPIILVTGNV